MNQDEIVIQQLRDAAKRKKLVAVFGTGSSIALTNNSQPSLSWRGLVEDGFRYGEEKGLISRKQTESWKAQLSSDDIDDLLGAAEFVTKKLQAPEGGLYSKWLQSVFRNVRVKNAAMANAIKAIQSANIPICTLNYDALLEEVTGLEEITLKSLNRVGAWMRRETDAVFHLHGVFNEPETCILGIRDYEKTLGNDVRDLVQRNLSAFENLLFVGCGATFADPNFTSLITWLQQRMNGAVPQHYGLVVADEVASRRADPAWRGFVEPLSFGVQQSDLPKFLLSVFPNTVSEKARKRHVASQTLKHKDAEKKVLETYRNFIVRDCGQMTVEGVGAGMELARQRFEIERLFVPLNVQKAMPEFPENDPDRDEKLAKWQKENGEPIPFGKEFKKHRRLALLALPGGGKTLLLKRLAVAYADPSRRESSSDELPDLDLFPVMLKCREWKAHIRSPIPTLLDQMAAITGQSELEKFSAAVLPLFKAGKALLLIDGLDELHDESDRLIFSENLEKFLAIHKKAYVVVTSRETGFQLVAPSISRICERWKIAPLTPAAIEKLTMHWHLLMGGENPVSHGEATKVASQILSNPSVKRLAENPLLLTMLLVVKHGAGRLPADRASLYSRAAEVLLDTWNVQGHEPLKTREALPQLACVAFELMRRGKQTATERELLELIHEARQSVQRIRLYATDTPGEFLRRVENRSSLLVKAGHQLENGIAVPFYQFRHLTFQEFLAALAAADGCYLNFKVGDNVLKPLEPYLLAQEWKEVIPMASALASQHAESLLVALVSLGDASRIAVEKGESDEGVVQWRKGIGELPDAVARLGQCLVEEASGSPETLASALKLLAFFAKGARGPLFISLMSGPYKDELLNTARALYLESDWPAETWMRNTYAVLLSSRLTQEYSREDMITYLNDKLRVGSSAEARDAALAIAGGYWRGIMDWQGLDVSALERRVFDANLTTSGAAVWAWALNRTHGGATATPDTSLMDRVSSMFFIDRKGKLPVAAFGLIQLAGIEREAWTPSLTEEQLNVLSSILTKSTEREPTRDGHDRLGAAIIAYHARIVLPDDQLAIILKEERGMSRRLDNVDAMLNTLKVAKHSVRKKALRI